MSRGDFIDSRQDLGCSKNTYILHRMGMKVSYVSSWIFCFVIFSFEPRPSVVHGRRVDKFANFTFKFAAIVPILLRQEICFLLPYYFVFLIFFVLYLSKIVLSQKKFLPRLCTVGRSQIFQSLDEPYLIYFIIRGGKKIHMNLEVDLLFCL